MEAIKSIGNHSVFRCPERRRLVTPNERYRLNTQLLLQRSVDFNQNFAAECVSLTRTSPHASTSDQVGRCSGAIYRAHLFLRRAIIPPLATTPRMVSC